MVMLCRLCGRPNPAEATYCHFDGAFLQGAQDRAAEDHAQSAFPEPFKFPSGQTCENFDQLALACQQRWKDTWELLKSGGFESLFSTLGRYDLIRANTEALAESDADRGVDYFLSRLPSRSLRPPRLNVVTAKKDLGVLNPGQDVDFNLLINNAGHRLIVGSVIADAPWLAVLGAPPGQPRLMQFVREQFLRVRVVGAKLAAAQQPREAKLLIMTNAGNTEIVVTCQVPIVPFPEGVLIGAKTPRELAHKAKQFPVEAAELFSEGKVQEWYRANGWIYPVEGEAATGKAAIQQFFEALGLTEPPKVVLDTPSLAFQGAPGQRLEARVELHTNDKRPIYASAHSATPWLTVAGCTAHGNRATVAIEANIPMAYDTPLRAFLEVHTNGNQRFEVPVVLHVAAPAAPPPPPQPPPLGPSDFDADVLPPHRGPVAKPETSRNGLMAVLGIAAVVVVLTLSAGCVLACLLIGRR